MASGQEDKATLLILPMDSEESTMVLVITARKRFSAENDDIFLQNIIVIIFAKKDNFLRQE